MNERWGEAEMALGDAQLAIDRLQAAIAADPSKLQAHVRDLVAAHMAAGETAKALSILDQLLQGKSDIPVDNRAWAMCKRIQIAMESGTGGKELQHAIDQARAALAGIPERDPAGRVLLWIGRAEYGQGKLDEAKRDLTDARQRFVVHHLDDGRAAILLGKIAEAQNDLETAADLYQDVVTRDLGTSIWAAARFGRAEVLALQNQPNEQMKTDYQFVINALATASEGPSIDDSLDSGNHRVPELVGMDQVRSSLVSQYERYSDADRLDDALMFLALQKEINDPETAAMAYRLASTKERRAAELTKEMDALPASDLKGRAAKRDAATALLGEAGEDYLRHAGLTTMDDAASGNSLWHAARLFDEAGETMKSVKVYEKFTTERPSDPRTPEGLLNMGLLYQSVGMLDRALFVYDRDIKENPRTPAAYSAAVNLARCYMALGAGPDQPENFEKAEKSLLSLVQDNADLLPTAKEFRVSLFTLGELYYIHGRWADAILRLEEAVARYPNDAGLSRAMFMLAESYRKSAGEIAEAIRKNPGIDHRDALQQARSERLTRAAMLFGRVIAALDVNGEDPLADTKLSASDEEYLHASYMDRAESYYELGEYSTAIKLYDQTATRFAQNRLAIEAYVQIVNSYLAMGEPRQANAAAERAQWILKRIPDEAFAQGPVPSGRQYYVDFFKLNESHEGTGGG
jgi:tetratricopeptide (TPR) repeat protein